MRFPRSFTDELRGQADIVRIVSDYVALKKRGANHVACCPFHHEKTPSFNVNAARQVFKCFGCGKAGDVFSFVMEIEGCPFPEAVKTVAEKCGVAIPVMQGDAREAEERDRQREDLRQLNQWAVEFFESSLETGEGKRARDYLEKRGISDEFRRYFRLGYAPDSWDALSGHLLRRGATKLQIERSGLVVLKDSGVGFYDRFRGRLMFPITDAQGRFVAFGGRILGEGEPKYLNSPETALYTKGQHLFGLNHARDSVRRQGYTILVEGYLDFLIPFQYGVRNLVASLGTALTEQQVRLLARYARQVTVNFEPGSAGVAATKRSLEALLAEGFKVNVLTLPDNLDPDEYIRKHGAEGYYGLLKNSQPFMDYVVEQAVKEHDQTTPAGKVETLNQILPYLKLVKNDIELFGQVERISDRLKLDSRLVRDEFKRAAATKQTQVSERAAAATLSVKPAEKKLLEVLLNHAPLRRRLAHQMAEEDFAPLRTAQLFRLIFELEKQGQEASYPVLSSRLDDADIVNDLLPNLLIEWGDTASDEDLEAKVRQWEREADESLFTLRCDRLAERQAALQMEIKQAQREGDAARVTELLGRKFELAKQERALRVSSGNRG
jgi:DNA primase